MVLPSNTARVSSRNPVSGAGIGAGALRGGGAGVCVGLSLEASVRGETFFEGGVAEVGLEKSAMRVGALGALMGASISVAVVGGPVGAGAEPTEEPPPLPGEGEPPLRMQRTR